MGIEKLPVTCPLCGRKNEFPLEILKEGENIVCPFCKVKLNLHGHMWQEIQEDLTRLKKEK